MNIKSLRNAFFSGLILLAPVAITVYVIKWLVESIGGPASGILFYAVPEELFDQQVIKGILYTVSALIVLVATTILGWLSKYFLGKMILQFTERLMTSVPVVKSVYSTVKQIFDTFSSQNKAVFQKVVLVEFPRPGIFAMGFLTGNGKGEVIARTGQELYNIFLPTTPNPTSGYLIMLPRSDVRMLDMSIPDGMKLIVSGGAVVPPYAPGETASEPVLIQNPISEAPPPTEDALAVSKTDQ